MQRWKRRENNNEEEEEGEKKQHVMLHIFSSWNLQNERTSTKMKFRRWIFCVAPYLKMLWMLGNIVIGMDVKMCAANNESTHDYGRL